MAHVAAKTTPCPVPADFDQETYGSVSRRLSPLSEEIAWSNFATGFNAVAFRFAATDHAHDRLSAALSGSGALSPSGPRYTKEEALFAFFVNAVSVIDCFYYAVFNIAACLGSTLFQVTTPEDLRRIHPSATVKAFKVSYPDCRLTSELTRVSSSAELKALKEHRDFLAHRGTPKRIHQVTMGPDRRVDMSAVISATITSNPKDVPSSWMSTLELKPTTTATPRAWLGTTVNGLLSATDEFLVTYPGGT